MPLAAAGSLESGPAPQRYHSLGTPCIRRVHKLRQVNSHIKYHNVGIHTVLLHINDHKCRGVRTKRSIMGPVIWRRRELALANFVLRNLARLLNHGTMVMSGIKNCKSPDPGGPSRYQHEGTIHETRCAPALACLLSKPISGPIMSTTVTAQPHLGRATWLFLGRGTGRFHDHIIAMCLPMILDCLE